MAIFDLLGYREAVFHKFPKEDPNFQWSSDFLDILGMSHRDSLLQLIVEGVG
jgi:hypothetical protein